MAGLSVAEDDPEVMHEVAALFASVITCRGALGGEAKIESAEAVEAEMAAEAEAWSEVVDEAGKEKSLIEKFTQACLI